MPNTPIRLIPFRGKTPEFFKRLTSQLCFEFAKDLHCRFGSYLPCQLVMIAFMADMLISEDLAIHLNFISEVILLIVDLWVVCRMLGSEVRC